MYLAPEGDEIDIADNAAKLLAGIIPIERLHAADSADLAAQARSQLGEQGWFGLATSEGEGGSGLSAVEQALFYREVGRQCGPVDVLAQTLATMTASDSQLRERLMSGRIGMALVAEDGLGCRVLGPPSAILGVHVERSRSTIVSLPSSHGENRSPLDPANSMRKMAQRPTEVLAVRSGEEVWNMGQLCCAAMLVGVAEAALDMIVAYAKIRETFGRKIGAYQAVRHPCADMALRVEAARSQLWFAAAAMKEMRTDALTHLDAAKLLANQAAVCNTDTNIQLHGGIGVTDDHNAHLLLKHALLLSRLFGSDRQLLKRLVSAQVGD